MKVIGNDKHSSLLTYRINYDRKNYHTKKVPNIKNLKFPHSTNLARIRVA
jgi:hypothetical protein